VLRGSQPCNCRANPYKDALKEALKRPSRGSLSGTFRYGVSHLAYPVEPGNQKVSNVVQPGNSIVGLGVVSPVTIGAVPP
jgi:hypothetical protein